VGFINLPGKWALGHLLGSWLKPVLNEAAPEFGAAQISLMLLTTLASAGVAYGGWRYYVRQSPRIKVGGNDPIYRATGDIWDGLAEAWYFDRFYEKLAVVPGFKALARFLAQVFDPQGVDGLVRGVGRLLGLASGGLRTLQTGLLRSYALFFLVGVVLMVGYFVMVR
jgi:NADH-quinone oxidoreductase subunit L